MENPKSRSEAILQNMLGEDNPLVPPKSRVEALLLALLNGGGGSLITIDTVVTEGSTNPVQNGAIWNFVNSSVATNTAYFIGTFSSVADLEAYSGELSNNDYAFVISTDSAGNTVYNRYKYNGDTQQWAFEYALNNSSFTAAQWGAINSGFVAADKTKLTNLANVPEITGNTTATGSMTWRFEPTADDLAKLQGVRNGDYSEILFTPIVGGVKRSIVLRRTSTSEMPEFTGICIDEYTNNTITMYHAAGPNGNNYIIVSKFEATSADIFTAGTAISLASNAIGVKVGGGLETDTNGNLKTTIVGEILSETAYSQLVTKDKDIYFTYD